MGEGSNLDQIRGSFLGGSRPVEPIGKSVGQVKDETEPTAAAAMAEHGIVGTAGVTAETAAPKKTFNQQLDRFRQESDAKTATEIANIREQSGQQ